MDICAYLVDLMCYRAFLAPSLTICDEEQPFVRELLKTGHVLLVLPKLLPGREGSLEAFQVRDILSQNCLPVYIYSRVILRCHEVLADYLM